MIKRFFRKLFGLGGFSAKSFPKPTGKPGSAHASANPGTVGAGSSTAAPNRAVSRSRKHASAPDSRSPKVYHAAQHGIDLKLVSHHALRVVEDLQKAGFKAFIVGGAVRDLLLGVRPKDFDVATNAEPEQVQRAFRRARIIGRRFRLVHVMFGPEVIEVSTFRALHSDDAETDPHGRVLRDNVFGTQHEDAARRDFTINALYFDPVTQVVLDYHDGVADLRARLVRIIGDPTKRYREDPVRMLRAVRFAAKLDCTIEAQTAEPIAALGPLLKNVPQARLFDEMLKLLSSGSALSCLKSLRDHGLHTGLLPLLDLVLDPPDGSRFVELALAATDQRVKQGKGVSAGFLFATLLWGLVKKSWEHRLAAGEHRVPALSDSIDEVLDAQAEQLAIQRKIVGDVREIWMLQPRFERQKGAAPYRLLEHLRLRAGFDFLVLRSSAGEVNPLLVDWWQAFIEGGAAEREALIKGDRLPAIEGQVEAPKKKRRRRKPRQQVGQTEGGEEAATESTSESAAGSVTDSATGSVTGSATGSSTGSSTERAQPRDRSEDGSAPEARAKSASGPSLTSSKP